MVQRLFARIRTSTAIAAALALIVTGVAAGAAGSYMVLGQSNDSGTSQTVLNNAGLGAAFTLKTTNQSTGATGIFGWSSSTSGNSTRGVYGRADGANSYGVYGVNNGAAGSGAAMYANGNANVGIEIDTDSNSVPPLKVNSTGRVVNLNSDMVDYFHANSLGRVAYMSTENASPDGTDGTPLTVDITAPTRGYFSVVASVDSYNFSANNTFTCQLNINGNYVGGSRRYIALVDNANEEQDCSTNATFKTCGGAATFTLTTSGVAATTSFEAGSMTVTFTPFDGNGNQPSILGCIVITPQPQPKLEP